MRGGGGYPSLPPLVSVLSSSSGKPCHAMPKPCWFWSKSPPARGPGSFTPAHMYLPPQPRFEVSQSRFSPSVKLPSPLPNFPALPSWRSVGRLPAGGMAGFVSFVLCRFLYLSLVGTHPTDDMLFIPRGGCLLASSSTDGMAWHGMGSARHGRLVSCLPSPTFCSFSRNTSKRTSQ